MWLLKPAHKHISRDTLSEHLDERLRGRPLERVEQRLGECGACRQDLAELQATVSMMRQLAMEPPRRSFVMSAPPPEPVRDRPALALRAPNWAYAGAASVAALALAITVSVDATGGLSSDPLRRDVAETALAPAPTSEQVTVTSGPAAEPAAAAGGEGTAPPSLAAEAPAAATADQPVQQQPAGEGATAFGAAKAPVATPAPEVSPDLAAEDSRATLTESAGVGPALTAVAPETAVVPEPAQAPSARGTEKDDPSAENQTAQALTIEAPTPISEPAGPELFEQDGGSGTSVWWRVLEAAAGALTAAFLAGLAFRWRASRRDSP